MSELLIYGANGYTGALIARDAVRLGLTPILAGRSEAVRILAEELGLPHRLFGLENSTTLRAGLFEIAVVLNCAGPFSQTAQSLADVCLQQRIHYLDITGEASVFAQLASRDADAREKGVMLLPGVGFDVVPSDCLAVHLKRRLPTATRLTLAFKALTRMSRGTSRTMVEALANGGLVRERGALRTVPAAWKTRPIDFGAGSEMTMTIPWGDIVTAYHSTGVPNIEVFMASPWPNRMAARLSRHLQWLLRKPGVQAWLKRRVNAGPPGPTAGERAQGRSLFWGEVVDDAGRTAVSRLIAPESYDLTVQTALAICRKVLAGTVKPGFQTPAMAFGADFILDIAGVTRSDD